MSRTLIAAMLAATLLQGCAQFFAGHGGERGGGGLREFDRDTLPLGEPQLMWAVGIHEIDSAARKAVARRKDDAAI